MLYAGVAYGADQQTSATSSKEADPTPPPNVEVINGSRTTIMTFRSQPSLDMRAQDVARKTSGKGPAQKNAAAAPSQIQVDVINGDKWETKTFDENAVVVGGHGSATPNTQPVVLWISSSDTRRQGAIKEPVVIGIASSESETREAASQRVGIEVSPHPKRPAYNSLSPSPK
jgi:hypothetical protein